MPALFNEEFMRSVARLRIVARQTSSGGRHGEHRSRDLGSGMEFRDFRSYVPGDDLRRVDFNLYRRTGRLFLRLFEEPEDLPVYVLLDVSASMFLEDPPRADAARQMAGVVLAASLNQHDRADVYPFGADLAPPLIAARGRGGLHRAFDYLERLKPAGPTDLRRAIHRFNAYRRRSGLVVVISDFFDARGAGAVVEALQSLRHRLLLVQVTRPTDATPPLAGELTLIDCESAASVDVTVTAAVRERYRRTYAAFCDALLHFAAQRRCAHLTLDADQPVLAQLGGVFRNGVFAT